MAGEIDQYVDTIRNDLRCGFVIRETNQAAPVMGRTAQLCGHVIFVAAVAVTVDFNDVGVVVRQYPDLENNRLDGA